MAKKDIKQRSVSNIKTQTLDSKNQETKTDMVWTSSSNGSKHTCKKGFEIRHGSFQETKRKTKRKMDSNYGTPTIRRPEHIMGNS